VYFVLNHAQAHKWKGNQDECNKILTQFDFSAMTSDILVAKFALEDNIEQVVEHMYKVGDTSNIMRKDSYASWVIFKEMRKKVEFKNAYKNIFDRVGLDYKIVTADTGVMGGLLSEEFQAITDIGEDTLVLCDSCNFASNIEVCESITDKTEDMEELKEISSYIEDPNPVDINNPIIYIYNSHQLENYNNENLENYVKQSHVTAYLSEALPYLKMYCYQGLTHIDDEDDFFKTRNAGLIILDEVHRTGGEKWNEKLKIYV
jgi:hypothetical protein